MRQGGVRGKSRLVGGERAENKCPPADNRRGMGWGKIPFWA